MATYALILSVVRGHSRFRPTDCSAKCVLCLNIILCKRREFVWLQSYIASRLA